MAILNLTDFGVKTARNHAALLGKKPIARGYYAAVFPGSREDTVLKLTVDAVGYWMMNCCAAAVEGVHFPKLIQNYGDVGQVSLCGEKYPLFLYEVERLVKLPVGSDARKLAFKVKGIHVATERSQWWGKDEARQEEYAAKHLAAMVECNKFPESINEALRDLATFCRCYPHAKPDMHMGNFMMRPATGELVFSDPLMDMIVYQAKYGKC